MKFSHIIVSEFPVGVSLEAEPNSGLPATAFDDVVVDKLMGVAAHLVELGAGLVGCQKCIHPQVKDYLRQNVSEKIPSLDTYITYRIAGNIGGN